MGVGVGVGVLVGNGAAVGVGVGVDVGTMGVRVAVGVGSGSSVAPGQEHYQQQPQDQAAATCTARCWRRRDSRPICRFMISSRGAVLLLQPLQHKRACSGGRGDFASSLRLCQKRRGLSDGRPSGTPGRAGLALAIAASEQRPPCNGIGSLR